MIEDVQQMIDNVIWLRDNCNKAMTAVLQDHLGDILKLNTEDQLYAKGVNTDGVSLASFHPYTPLTIRLKTEKGQKVSNVTLKDEGDFYSNFGVRFFVDHFQIGSDDWKAPKLSVPAPRGWGQKIFGLTIESIEKLRALVKEPFINKLRAGIN